MYNLGMSYYLNARGVLLKEFNQFAPYYSNMLKVKTEEYCKSQDRPFIYLPSHNESKEKMAENIAHKDKIVTGLICNFSALELCNSYKAAISRQSSATSLRMMGLIGPIVFLNLLLM